MEYGCPVSNRFGFASDDDDFEDPSELVQRAAKEAAIAKTAPKKVAIKTASQPAKKEETNKPAEKVRGTASSNVRGAHRGRGSRGGTREGGARPPREGNNLADRFGESNNRSRGTSRGDRGGRPSRGGNANSSADEAPKDATFDSVTPMQKHGASHEHRGDRGGFRGGRGGRGRQFDRHSGSDRTGVRSSEKKEGHGKGNWGTHSDEMIGETEPVGTDEEPEEPAVPREKTAAELQYESELAEYNKMKTLKEFKAEQKAEATEFKTRKGGEGVKDDFGKLVPLQKDQDHKEDIEEVIVTRKETNKKIVPVSLSFAETKRGGSGRGRGESRGEGRGEGRGAGRGGQRTRGGSRFDASSAEDFPVLK